jgi:hypothetical protein
MLGTSFVMPEEEEFSSLFLSLIVELMVLMSVLIFVSALLLEIWGNEEDNAIVFEDT